jgi:stage V sporulation protein SpoVS
VSGELIPISQELTPEAVASAVWAAIATANNTAGTMGAKLNLASSGGVDYEDLAQAVRDELTAELIAIGVIKAKTDSLTFDVAGQVNSNITFVNDVEIQGSGTDSNPFNPS